MVNAKPPIHRFVVNPSHPASLVRAQRKLSAAPIRAPHRWHRRGARKSFVKKFSGSPTVQGSFHREPVQSGVQTSHPQLREPTSPMSVDRPTQDAAPEVWKRGQTNFAVGASGRVPSGIETGTRFGYIIADQGPSEAVTACRFPSPFRARSFAHVTGTGWSKRQSRRRARGIRR